ncbi:MAG TPA: response regulator [Bdellovibrionota bacterium]|nr:response regulator [Bdellovibrionota bacterium]
MLTTGVARLRDWLLPEEDYGRRVGLQPLPTRIPKRVLVIEDDLALSTVIDRVLQSLDPSVEVDWAVTEEEARERVMARAEEDPGQPYQLIFTDIFLGGPRTGLDFWRWCQRIYPDLPLVVTSGLATDRFYDALGAGEVGPPYLPKPFTVDECYDLLVGVLNYDAAP